MHLTDCLGGWGGGWRAPCTTATRGSGNGSWPHNLCPRKISPHGYQDLTKKTKFPDRLPERAAVGGEGRKREARCEVGNEWTAHFDPSDQTVEKIFILLNLHIQGNFSKYIFLKITIDPHHVDLQLTSEKMH